MTSLPAGPDELSMPLTSICTFRELGNQNDCTKAAQRGRNMELEEAHPFLLSSYLCPTLPGQIPDSREKGAGVGPDHTTAKQRDILHFYCSMHHCPRIRSYELSHETEMDHI